LISHQLVEKIVVRHFRGTTELPYLTEENNYDFNFQDFRRFDEKRTILSGDHITVECTYNTETMDKPIFVSSSTIVAITLADSLLGRLGWIIYQRRDVHGISGLLSSHERSSHLFERSDTPNRDEAVQRS